MGFEESSNGQMWAFEAPGAIFIEKDPSWPTIIPISSSIPNPHPQQQREKNLHYTSGAKTSQKERRKKQVYSKSYTKIK